MKKIAIIFNGDLHNRKGYINAVLERAKRLCPQKEFSTDVFCLSTYDHWLDRKLRHTPKAERATQIEVDGLTINMIWYPFSLIDYILSVKLHKGRIIEPIIFKRNLSRFVDYDLICAHSTIPGEFAYMLYEQYNIPYITTWHGSDVHTAPFVNSNYRDTVKRNRLMPRVMENRLITFQRSRMASFHSSRPHSVTMQGPKQWKCLQFMVSMTQPSESTQTR